MGLGSSSRRLMKRSKDVCVCGAAAPSLTINPYSKYAAGLFSYWQQSHDAMQCSDESSTESCIIIRWFASGADARSGTYFRSTLIQHPTKGQVRHATTQTHTEERNAHVFVFPNNQLRAPDK